MTMAANASRRPPGVKALAHYPRYCGRRRDRPQNGVAGGLPAPPAAPEESPERGRRAPAGQLLPVAGPGGEGWAPDWRTGGCAAPRDRVVPVAPLRAQPADAAPV